MSHERFNKGMDELKKKYNESPSNTSSNEIFQAVKEEKQKKKRFRSWPAVAASIAALFIGAVLTGSLFTTEEISQDPGNDSGSRTGDLLEDEQNENTDTPDQTSDDEKEPTANEEGTEDASNKTDEHASDVQHREKTVVRSVYPEGQEDQYTFNLHVSENLRFSTYIEEKMIYVEELTEDGAVETFYPDFAGSGEIFSEETYIQVSQISDHSLDKWEDELLEQSQAEGYEQHELYSPEFEYADRQGLLIKGDLQKYYALIEHEEGIYSIKTQMTVEFADGALPFMMKIFVDELVF
ncbi:hypothetical protein LGQ02_05770 [Bacillus shivajii]|uniref:hypothetical protein n=1 Tax=Bacillus shivajii TaxID=1983719 RepID=UPI001CFB1A64|nr:hypothetical protein [Bacillus shivajii]UCZ54270.1 hypothetical protein LGQ02_05770 [Bacillus shivajii]